MKTLNKLYPYLTESDLLEGREKLVNRLLKVRKFSEKKEAEQFIAQTFEKKIKGEDRTQLECDVVTFFNQIKRELSPMGKAVRNAKGIYNSMPVNSKLTIKQ